LFGLTALELSACVTGTVTVPNTRACTVAGVISAGAMCAETITGIQSDLSFDEFLDFLEPQEERPDPAHPGQTLPARGGAVCQSASDWGAQKTALEQACRILGRRCPPELVRVIETMTTLEAR
jgi:hypothetical protein